MMTDPIRPPSVEKEQDSPSPVRHYPKPSRVRVLRYTRDQAARMIQRFFLRKALLRRGFSDVSGVEITRKVGWNKLSGSMETLYMFLHADSASRCCSIQFLVYDNAVRRFVKDVLYDQLPHLNEFELHKLFQLAKPSLDRVRFERQPFRLHFLCLRSIIEAYRV